MPLRRRRLPALLVASLLGLVAPVVSGTSAGATNDPHWPRQWAPAKVGAPAAWGTTTGAGVKIGIVDSGVDVTHEDLQARVVANAACIGTNGDAAACAPNQGQDQVGHGTHVAGIAAATKDNGRGIAGMAPSAQLVVARVFEGESADLSDVEAGIQWVVSQGARVVNLSLGETRFLGGLLGGGEGSLGPALEAAWAAGAIPVIAAGNAQLLSGSATYGNVNAVVVGATGPDDRLASYSVPTEQAKWALLAPGGDGSASGGIYSTFKGGQYAYLSGTSMAVPHVSGALALLLSRGVSQQRAVELVLSAADRRVSCGPNSPTCVGRLDVAAAVAATGGAPAPVPATAPAPAPTAAPAPASSGAAATARSRRRPVSAPAGAGNAASPAPQATGEGGGDAPAPAPEPAAPEPAAPPEPPVDPVVEPPPVDVPVPLAAAAAGGDDDEVTVPGVLAAALLALVAAGAVLARRRAGA